MKYLFPALLLIVGMFAYVAPAHAQSGTVCQNDYNGLCAPSDADCRAYNGTPTTQRDCRSGFVCCEFSGGTGGGTTPPVNIGSEPVVEDQGGSSDVTTLGQDEGSSNGKGSTVTRYGLLNPFGTRTVPGIVAAIINWAAGLAGSLFFLYLLWGGIQWMTAGGKTENVQMAQKRIMYAIVGIAVILLSYFIVDALIGLTNVIQ